jgi:glycosyltransferase domain-containing protein
VDLSLIVPTYNRPQWVSRLSRFLAPFRNSFRLLVLDSSEHEIAESNRLLVGELGPSASHIAYPSSTLFKDKLLDGLQRVDTEFCAFCADDDLVLPKALIASARFLRQDRNYSGAHGLYFAYSGTGGAYFVDDILYCHRGLDSPSVLERLACLFEDYQSNFYAVFRTKVQLRALKAAALQDSSLFFELMQSAHTAIEGRVARLPMIYAGRSRSPSAGTRQRWHPVEWIALDTQGYFKGYAAYRDDLLRALYSIEPESGRDDHARRHTEQLVDLMHLRYSVDTIRSSGLGAAISAQLAGAPEPDIGAAAFAAAYGPPLPAGIRPGGPAWRLAMRLSRLAASFLAGANRFASKIRRGIPEQPGRRRILQGRRARVEFNDHLPGKLAAFDPSLAEAGLQSILSALDDYSEAFTSTTA